MIKFIGPLYCYNISQITVVDWTLSTSDHTTPPTELLVRVTLRLTVSLGVEPRLGLKLSVNAGFSLHSLGSDHTQNTFTA
jgi:hypothetical protein